MKRLPVLLLILFTFNISAQKLPYVIDPVTKKQITYTISTDGPNKFRAIFSNGKTAYLSFEDIDFKKVYAKSQIPVTIPPPAVSQEPAVIPSAAIPRIAVTLGEGSGDLDMGEISNKNIRIKPGSYASISFSKAQNVVIDATDVTMHGGVLDLNDASGVEIYGLSITDQTYRAVNIRGFCTGLYLHDMTFKNIGNTVINYEYKGLWDGTDATTSKDWKFERLTFINTSQPVGLGGEYAPEGIRCMMSNFKFLHNTIKNCPEMGNIIYCAAADNYEIAGNVIDNINTKYASNAPNGIHNGIFHMVGNGSLHDNTCSNHQGNLIRAWGLSFGKVKKEILIYNNKVYNSWKYSAFELQVPPFLQEYQKKYPGRIRFTNAKVYNNTAGHLNVSKDWEGMMLDLYNTFGTVVYKNNLGFEMVSTHPELDPGQRSMINAMNGTETKLILGTNKYFKTQAGAVSKSFRSLTEGIGAK